jgi:hypothetical protein
VPTPLSKLRLSREACVVRHNKVTRRMTGLGQTRTLDNVRVTSVKLLIADSKRTFSYVRSGPETPALPQSPVIFLWSGLSMGGRAPRAIGKLSAVLSLPPSLAK